MLTLSATPIPRTLHLALSGVRDISNISTPPRGRLSIDTHIEPHNHTQIKEALERELKRAGQAYYLYNNIETIELKKKELQALVPKARFGVLHGQLPEQEVASVMHGFDKGEIDILVCSTIIENGLDLPNVNTLVVDNAVQFGLSQLHQIRGRIGRGVWACICGSCIRPWKKSKPGSGWRFCLTSRWICRWKPEFRSSLNPTKKNGLSFTITGL